MGFNIGDSVVHKSDRKPRKMVVVARAFKELPPSNFHNEMANIGRAPTGATTACGSPVNKRERVISLKLSLSCSHSVRQP